MNNSTATAKMDSLIQSDYAGARHEMKHIVGYGDALALSSRLSVVMKKDSHSLANGYIIRSLYFDTLDDSALKDKINGVNNRDKFRLRMYNNDKSYILLEKKSKRDGFCIKTQTVISETDAMNIILGKSVDSQDKLLQEFNSKAKIYNLKPKVLVEYTREAFIYDAGNVRVTIDSNIRTGLYNTDFFNQNITTMTVDNNPIILEVKWDAYLPTIISRVIQTPGCRTSAYSKYAASRMYE